MSDQLKQPAVSVLIEGYNDSLDLGSALETVNSLADQTYCLKQVEIILTGNQAQAARWREALAGERRFYAVKVIGADAHYYRLKNLAAEAAQGEILAFTDSDALPEPGWLEAIVRGIDSGAAAVAGITLFRPEKGTRFPSAAPVAASISWGFIVGNPGDPPRGFLSHNVGFKRSIFKQIRYREDLGRTCAGSFLYDELKRNALPGSVPARSARAARVHLALVGEALARSFWIRGFPAAPPESIRLPWMGSQAWAVGAARHHGLAHPARRSAMVPIFKTARLVQVSPRRLSPLCIPAVVFGASGRSFRNVLHPDQCGSHAAFCFVELIGYLNLPFFSWRNSLGMAIRALDEVDIVRAAFLKVSRVHALDVTSAVRQARVTILARPVRVLSVPVVARQAR